MPRQKQPLNYEALLLSRTVGLEIEGYMKKSPRGLTIAGCEVKRDGSLSNCYWDDPDAKSYGVEIVTSPLSELTPLPGIFEKILEQGWSASGAAGLHIHVDASDFSMQDKLRFAEFAKRMEDVIHLFVRNRRYDNRYCRLMPPAFATLSSVRGFEEASSLMELRNINRENRDLYRALSINRYQWANIFNSHYPTIEFRLFHPIRKAEDGAKFAYMVHNLVNLVKHSSPEHLEFIASSIEAETSVEGKAKKFLDSLGISYALPVVNEKVTAILERKIMQQRELNAQ